MPTKDAADTRDFWNRNAADWRVQVGDAGDRNRFLASDPVLWAFAGEVAGRDVLDAGCGTGYLARQLAARGARVVGVDHSEAMLAIARQAAPDVDFQLDSASELATLEADAFDILVSNYVLMDLPDLEGAARAFHRVLRPGGRAALIFSHPCFPNDDRAPDDGVLRYEWRNCYFERARRDVPPWGHFAEDFIWFHRPLSDYFKAFLGAGFEVTGFEEPRLTPERAHLAKSDAERRKFAREPFSVAFQLRKR